MTVFECTERKEDEMDEKKIQKFRQRLLEEYQKLIRSINRNRLAEEEIKLEKRKTKAISPQSAITRNSYTTCMRAISSG